MAPNTRARLFFLLSLLAPLSAAALELKKVGAPVKVADARVYKYAYAPSIIYTAGAWHAYYCSAGRGVGDWDHVRHASSPDLQRWSTQDDLIQSTLYERANCDPSVIRFDAGDGPYYYMVYSGNVENVQTLNFLARSGSPAGPFLKLSRGGTWEQAPAQSKVIVAPKVPAKEGTNIYGAGQASLVVKEKEVYQFYTDVTQTPPGIWLTTSTNLKDWSAPRFTGLGGEYSSVDVKYDDAAKEFVVVALMKPHQPGATIEMRASADGLTWANPRVICDEACTPDYANNVGMSGDDQGHIYGEELLVAYGAPYELGPKDKWGNWHVWGTRFEMRRVGSVLGFVDRVSDNPATIEGWACGFRGDASIDVHVYAGGPAGAGTLVGGFRADQPSEGAVSKTCDANGKAYRFRIKLSPEQAKKAAGKPIFVHGISPNGGVNALLDNSGKFRL